MPARRLVIRVELRARKANAGLIRFPVAGQGVGAQAAITQGVGLDHLGRAGLEHDLNRPVFAHGDDSTRVSGCLHVISGSHWPGTCYLHWLDGRPDLALNQTVAEDQLDEAAAVDLELEAGRMLIDEACMIHRSRANRSNPRRAGLAIRCVLATSLYDRNIKMQGGAAAIRQDMCKRPIYLVRDWHPAGNSRLVRIGRSRSATPSEGVRRMEGIGQ